MPKKLVRTKKLIGEAKRVERMRRAERTEIRKHGARHSPFFDVALKKKGHKAIQPPTEVSVYWDDTAYWSRREMLEMTFLDQSVEGKKLGTWAKIQYRESPTHLEIYSIDVRPKGTGYGTKIMKDIFEYADAKNKGVVATKVKNEKFAESLGMKRRDPELSHRRKLSDYTGYAEYIHGRVPHNAIDYSWVTRTPDRDDDRVRGMGRR